MAGLQGPFYGGTNTFHRRNTIYGLYPHEIETVTKGPSFNQCTKSLNSILYLKVCFGLKVFSMQNFVSIQNYLILS